MSPINHESCRSISNNTKIALGLLTIAALSIPTVFMSTLPAAPVEAKDKPNESQLTSTQSESSTADEVTAAAKETYEEFREYYRIGQTTIEGVVTWSQRWFAAEMESAKSTEEKLEAAKGHLKRIKDVQSQVDVQYNAGRNTKADVSACRYFAAQANLQVQKAELAVKK